MLQPPNPQAPLWLTSTNGSRDIDWAHRHGALNIPWLVKGLWPGCECVRRVFGGPLGETLACDPRVRCHEIFSKIFAQRPVWMS